MLSPPVSYLWPLVSRLHLPCTKCRLKPGPGPRSQPQTLVLVASLSLPLASFTHYAVFSMLSPEKLSFCGHCPTVPNLCIFLPPIHPTFPCHRAFAHTLCSTWNVLPSFSPLLAQSVPFHPSMLGSGFLGGCLLPGWPEFGAVFHSTVFPVGACWFVTICLFTCLVCPLLDCAC